MQFLSWETLATFSGAVGMTVLIVQLLKLPLDRVWKVPTRLVAYVVCALIMLGAAWAIKGQMNAETVALTLLNAVLGALSAMSVYEVTIQLPEEKRIGAIYGYLMQGVLPEDQKDAEADETADNET